MENWKLDLERIKNLRKQLNLTQKQLANLAGVSQSLIAKIESGNIDPAYSKFVALSKALEAESKRKTNSLKASDIMNPSLISVSPQDKLKKVFRLMRERGISQIPVFNNNLCVGSVADKMLSEWIEKYGDKLSEIDVGAVMGEAYPTIPSDASSEVISNMLRFYRAILVINGEKSVGIITRADLLKSM